MYRLAVVSGPNRGSVFSIGAGETSIGRQSGNVIILPSAKVSKRHCLLVSQGNELILRDMGSSNGTFVNGVLIKMRRVSSGDKISVGDFVLEVKQAVALPAAGGPGGTDALPHLNNIIQFPGTGIQSDAPSARQTTAPKDLKSRLLWAFEHRFMPIFYNLTFKSEWRFVAIGIAVSIVLWNLVVSVNPLLQSKEKLLLRESAKRARFIARQIVDLNSAAIAAKAETRTNIGRIMQEPEVRIAYLIDLDGRIIAPAEKMNQLLTSDAEASVVVRARQIYRQGSAPGLALPVGPIVVAVEPLEVFNPQLGKNVVVALGLVSIDTRYASGEMSEVGMIYSETLIMMAAMSALLFLILYRLVMKPFEILNEDIDRVLKGEMEQVTHEFKFSELNQLWDVINSALQRIPKSKGEGASTGSVLAEDDGSAENYQGVAKSIAGLPGVAVALLDASGAIQFLNPVFEEITGLRVENVSGQALASVARDQAFGSFVTDALERTATGSEGVIEDFEFAGVTYRIRVGAVGSVGSKPRSFLMVASRAD